MKIGDWVRVRDNSWERHGVGELGQVRDILASGNHILLDFYYPGVNAREVSRGRNGEIHVLRDLFFWEKELEPADEPFMEICREVYDETTNT